MYAGVSEETYWDHVHFAMKEGAKPLDQTGWAAPKKATEEEPVDEGS